MRHSLKVICTILCIVGGTRDRLVSAGEDGHIMYHCKKCDKKYKHKQSLSKHLLYECGKEPKFACQFCPYKAKQKCALQAHAFCKHKVKIW